LENKLINKTTYYLAYKLNTYTNKDGLELQKMKLGIEIFLINVSKLIIIYLLSALLDIVQSTLFVHSAFILVKRYSFGLHALNSTVCTLVSVCMFVFIPFILSGVGIGNHIVLPIHFAILFFLYLYAPADTKARPIVGLKNRRLLKKKAFGCGVAVMLATLLIPSEPIKLLLTLGAIYQCMSILPITYKILKRSEKNYEHYEQTKA